MTSVDALILLFTKCDLRRTIIPMHATQDE